jgi:arginase family enzyme
MPFKLLGAALDALDDPDRVNLKRAYIQAAQAGRLPEDMPLDPYDLLAPLLVERCGPSVRPFGKLELPGWLTPRPGIGQASWVHPERYRAFLDQDGIGAWVAACASLIEDGILPDIPCLIAVDHGMTAGPLKALAGRFAPEETTVVILDSHFDAIPARLRGLPGQVSHAWGPGNCGSFLAPLLEEGTLLPENLFVVGVSDYAYPHTAEPYRQAYLSLIARGVTVIPRDEAEEESFAAELEERLCRSRGRRLYLSLDADAGALQCVHAARFLDTVGLSEQAILGTARLLRRLMDRGRFELIGLDAAEVDVHLLGIEDDRGMPDRTAEVCAGFLSTLMALDS